MKAAGAARSERPRGRLFAQARFVMGAGPGVAFFGHSRRARPAASVRGVACVHKLALLWVQARGGVLWALPAGAARGERPRGRLCAQARFVMGAGPGVAFFGRSRRAAFINFDLKGDFHAQIFYNRHTV